jgi:hypothetical protein
LERASRETFQGTPKRRLLVKDSIPTLLSSPHPSITPAAFLLFQQRSNIFFSISQRYSSIAAPSIEELQLDLYISSLDMWR